VFVLSRFGLKTIVGFADPLLGLCGGIFLAACAAEYFWRKKSPRCAGQRGENA